MFSELKPHARCLGWAFLLAWVFCVFYSGSMDGLASTVEAQTGGGPTELMLNVLPVGSAVATLIAVVACEKRLGPPTESRKLVVASPIAVAAATPVLLLPTPNALLSSLLFVAASVATGVGSGLMWVMWGQLYAKLPQDAVELCAPASAVIAAVLSLVVMVLPPVAGIVLVTVFPLISGLLFAKEWPQAETAQPADHAPAPAKPAPFREASASMGHVGFGILAACLFVSVEGSFWLPASSNALAAAGIFTASAVFMLAVSISATAGPRRVSLGFAYRWMCPVMVAGFAALIVAGPGVGAYVAAAVGIAARFAFCLITQMYFATYAARGKATAVQAFGMGWVFVHLGDLLGVVVFTPLNVAIGYGVVSLSTAAAVLIVACTAAFMLAMGEGNMFPSWDFGLRKAEGATAAGAAATGGTPKPGDPLPAVGECPGGADGGSGVSGPGGFGFGTGQTRPATGETIPEPFAVSETVVASSAASRPSQPGASSSAAAAGPRTAQALSPASDQTPTQAAPAQQPALPAPAADPLEARIAELARDHKLTPRETEVFGLLAHGRSIPYVRDALFISRDTAATHAKHIYAKLDVHSRQELIDLVMSQG